MTTLDLVSLFVLFQRHDTSHHATIFSCIINTNVLLFKLTYLGWEIALAITNTGTAVMAIYVWLKIQKLFTKTVIEYTGQDIQEWTK